MKKRNSPGGPVGGPAGGPAGRERPISVDEAREKVIDILSESFAQDLVSIEDFERRVTLAQAAGTMLELGTAIEGLRGGGPGIPAARGDELATLPRVAADLPAGRIRPADRAVAIFGETTRKGAWIPARRNTLVAVMGSMELDLREALLGPGETVFTVTAVMGSVEVIVPPGLHVECSGSAILGSFEHGETPSLPSSGNMPMVRIDGFAVLSSVEVEYRYPGESGREARRRRRREKRERRRLRRGGRGQLGPGP